MYGTGTRKVSQMNNIYQRIKVCRMMALEHAILVNALMNIEI